MAEIKLQKRYKYAGDIMPKLLDIGFDLDTASNFLNDIPDADVAPRAEVAREIFEEIDKLITNECLVFKDENGIRGYVDASVHYAIAELKKKYTEGQK